jgi:hypothetical protein
MGYYLEEDQKEIQLLLGRAAVKAHATSVKNCANQPNSEVVIGHVKRRYLAGSWGVAFYNEL